MTKHILFLCTGNSARSILAESLVNDPSVGGGRFRAFSAGSHPKGQIHPLALATLQAHGHAVDGLRSKSWDEFGAADAPRVDYVITVCDNAAAEACPMWPGHPATEHWSLPDPAAVEGTAEQRRAAFQAVYDDLRGRIADFLTRR
jgi:arsenate reductase